MKEALKALADAANESKAAVDLIKDINHRAIHTGEYTNYVCVEVKHRTHIVGINGHPKYTYHTEARFNQPKYYHDISAAKACIERAADVAKQAQAKIRDEAQRHLSIILSAKSRLSDISANPEGHDISTISREYQEIMDCENVIQNNRDAYVSCINQGNNYRLQYDHARMKSDLDSLRSIRENISRAAQEKIDAVRQVDKALRLELGSHDSELMTLIQQNSMLDVSLVEKRSCTAGAEQELNFWQQKYQRQQEEIFRVKRESSAREEKMLVMSANNKLTQSQIAETQRAQYKLIESKSEQQRSELLLKALKRGEANDLALIEIIKAVGFNAEYLAYLAIKQENIGALNLALSYSKKFDSYTTVKGETLLQYAINNDKKNTVIGALLAAHKDKLDFTVIKALSQDDQKTIGFLTEENGSLLDLDKLFYGQTLFESAVTANKLAIANYLRGKINVEAQIVTMLDRMQRENKINIESIDKCLRFSSDDIEAPVMYFALEKGMLRVVELLMQYRTDDLQECLLMAVAKGSKEVVDKILGIEPRLKERNEEMLREFLPSDESMENTLEIDFHEWIAADNEEVFFDNAVMGDYWDRSVRIIGND
jgi:hypothetical protein